jgi:DNA-binding CsgD family transcriptional regulator
MLLDGSYGDTGSFVEEQRVAVRSEPALSVLEAAYRLGGNREEWLSGIAEAARPLGASALVAQYSPDPPPFSLVGHSVMPHQEELVEAFLEADAVARDNPITGPTIHSTLACQTTSEAMAGWGLDLSMLDALYAPRMHPLGIRDSLNIQGADTSGHALCIMCGQDSHSSVPPAARHVWQRVAVHLAAALRLRRVLDDPTPQLALDSAQAIFDASGQKLLHASTQAGDGALDHLRAAVRAVDRARSREFRRDTPRALELWQGLFAGKWSLVDVFDSDGRRFFVAHENPPHTAEDRRLTRRERQAVILSAIGHSDELAAYALGIAPTTYRVHVRRAMRKLGVKSRLELVALAHSLVPREVDGRAER